MKMETVRSSEMAVNSGGLHGVTFHKAVTAIRTSTLRFRRNLLALFSAGYSETLVAMYQNTRRHIPVTAVRILDLTNMRHYFQDGNLYPYVRLYQIIH
jgi:hypothetical protein